MQPIEELEDLTVRTYSALKRNGIDYVEQIRCLSWSAIINFKNIHRKSIEELERLLEIEFTDDPVQEENGGQEDEVLETPVDPEVIEPELQVVQLREYNIGQEYSFKHRDRQHNIMSSPGAVLSTDKVTTDGMPYAEVQIAGRVRKYSLLH